MTDEEASIEYQISENVLEAIVRGALEGEKRARAHTGGLGRKGVNVEVEDNGCLVTVHLDGQLGEDLMEVGTFAQERIALMLSRMTGLSVSGVDIAFESVYPVGRPD